MLGLWIKAFEALVKMLETPEGMAFLTEVEAAIGVSIPTPPTGSSAQPAPTYAGGNSAAARVSP